MPKQHFLLLAAISGFIAVALGAFGAHGLKPMLSAQLYTVYTTAVEYQFYHTLALFGVALVRLSHRCLNWAGWAFVAGILLFSGSLYLLALTGVHTLGAVTPVGGVAFLLGWGLLGYVALVANRR